MVSPRGKNSMSRTPFLSQKTVHMILHVDMVCLNFFFLSDAVCLHSMDSCFDARNMWDTQLSSPVTIWSRNSLPCSLYRVRKLNALEARLVLCSSVSILGTHREHNFRYCNRSHRDAAFVELPNPSPDHSITNGIFTKLMINVSWFDVSRIQETDNRSYLTVGGVLDHLKHFNWSQLTTHMDWSSETCMPSLPEDWRRKHACKKLRCSNATAIIENGTYFKNTPRTNCAFVTL